MNTFAKHTQNNKKILSNRITMIQQLTSVVHNHILFQDTLNFNFLFHLYSTKLEDLYNRLPEISEKEFEHRVDVLSQSVEQLKPFIISWLPTHTYFYFSFLLFFLYFPLMFIYRFTQFLNSNLKIKVWSLSDIIK